MPVNPATKPEHLNSPISRANDLNDPGFENQQGYFPYDLTHQEYITPLFSHITPCLHIDTVPADRCVVHNNVKTILNQINGNFLSQLNQYVDSFYVPLRSVFPTNYEKLIPNPTKGQDLPNSALPQVPFKKFVYDYLMSSDKITYGGSSYSVADIYNGTVNPTDDLAASVIFYGRLTLLATVLSRGQLLDYLGLQFDIDNFPNNKSRLQQLIDQYFQSLWQFVYYNLTVNSFTYVVSRKLSLTSNVIITDVDLDRHSVSTLPEFRQALSDIFEAGRFPIFDYDEEPDWDSIKIKPLFDAAEELISALLQIFNDSSVSDIVDYINDINSSSNPFGDGGYINIGKVLAYQQCVAQFYTNDSVDNIFDSDLYMQLLRSTMYPTPSGSLSTSEPVFLYNGVQTEYDYISSGGFAYSLLTEASIPGHLNRQYVFMTLMFLLRRSLRYGDYFSTARPRMLAVGQLGIPVDNNGMVSPVDVTQNLLKQRYLNAANYIGSGFMQYMSSIHGVVPSDTGTKPRFVSHRKIELQNQITNNTADNQGAQTTNIVGYADDTAFDVFIDDFGYLLSFTSYDVLPVYKSGIENTYHFADRFDYFNPMLQNIGDQPIRLSEMIGNPANYNSTFGYTMRNSEYKYKLSKQHGAFCNSLSGYMLTYPLSSFIPDGENLESLKISPDFIRDKAIYLDPTIPVSTGVSPAEYFHFICCCVNQVQCARKIQSTPPVLF